jgi:GNAT superfamily N-acetyltransferase
MEKTVEELLNTPYWIVDILPEQVPADCNGQYFKVEKYYLGRKRFAEIKQKHVNLVLKLNCYRDVTLEDADGVLPPEVNPVPAKIEQEMRKRYVPVRVGDALIISEPDDTHLTLFNPDEELLALVRTIAAGEGLFVWQTEEGMGVTVRRFENGDAGEVSALIARTLREVSIKDYSHEYIEALVLRERPEDVLERAAQLHFYVACAGEKIVGCGGIGPYWGSETESWLSTVFVLPEYIGKGVGRKIIETLEGDEFFLRAKRVEIPASVTAVGFYLKMGYNYKNGSAAVDGEGLVRLEKIREI